MDSGGSSNPRQTYPKRTGIVINEGAGNPRNGDDLSANPQQSLKRAADQYMPIAHVVRIMRRVLPPHAKIADDAKETIQECVSEFISFVTTAANERCHGEYRKTISADDVISAMGSLGFDNYVEPLAVFLDNYRAQDPARGVMHRHVPYARRGVHAPPAQMAQPPPPPPPGPPMDHGGNYVGLPPQMGGYNPPQMGGYNPPQMGGYFVGNQGGGEGSSGGAELDPFVELFK